MKKINCLCITALYVDIALMFLQLFVQYTVFLNPQPPPPMIQHQKVDHGRGGTYIHIYTYIHVYIYICLRGRRQLVSCTKHKQSGFWQPRDARFKGLGFKGWGLKRELCRV